MPTIWKSSHMAYEVIYMYDETFLKYYKMRHMCVISRIDLTYCSTVRIFAHVHDHTCFENGVSLVI